MECWERLLPAKSASRSKSSANSGTKNARELLTLLTSAGLWSRKDFQPKESESQKILTTPTPGRPFAHQLWLFMPLTFASVTLGNLSSLTLQQEMQRTNLHTFTQGPFQISSVPWAHHSTYTLWMQPFGACITEISICSLWLALSLLRDVGYATMNENSHGSSSIVT